MVILLHVLLVSFRISWLFPSEVILQGQIDLIQICVHFDYCMSLLHFYLNLGNVTLCLFVDVFSVRRHSLAK